MKRIVIYVILISVVSCSTKKQKSIEDLKIELSESLHNGDTISAIEMLEEFNKNNPENIETQAALVVLRTKAGLVSIDEGFNQIMNLRNQDSSNYFTSQLDVDEMDYSTKSSTERLEIIEKSITKMPLYFWNYLEKGRLLIELERFDEAIESFDKAIELEPENRYAYADRALAKYLMGYKKEACKEWETSGGGGLMYRDKYCE